MPKTKTQKKKKATKTKRTTRKTKPRKIVKKKKEKSHFRMSWSILWQNSLTFLVAQIIAGITAVFLFAKRGFEVAPEPVPWYYFLTSFIIATLFIVLAIRFLRGGRFFILIFYFVIVLGAFTVFQTVMPFELALAVALIILILRLTVPQIWSHNVALIFGLAGLSASIGLDLKPLGVVIILVILSIYDYIAVYRTKTMVKMFKGLLSRGIIFSIVIPEHAHNWFVDLKKVKPKEGFMFLGTGDIALPMIFAASVISTNVISAALIILGSLIGVMTIHILFAIQKKRSPMPALPPIAFFSILGYLISLYL